MVIYISIIRNTFLVMLIIKNFLQNSLNKGYFICIFNIILDSDPI